VTDSLRRYRDATGQPEGMHVLGGVHSGIGHSHKWLKDRAASVIRDILEGRNPVDALMEFEELTEATHKRFKEIVKPVRCTCTHSLDGVLKLDPKYPCPTHTGGNK